VHGDRTFVMPSRLYLPTSILCIVCGKRESNQSSLGVRWYVDAGCVKTRFPTSSLQMGYKGIVHGGVLSGLLDEALCWVAGVHCKQYFITGTLTMVFRQSIPVGSTLTIVGTFDVFNGRYAECHGEIEADNLGVCAEGRGQFFPVPSDKALASNDYWVFERGDLDILTGKTI
jgi:acyl-coenzyme A thioesterase PaaI-like protein